MIKNSSAEYFLECTLQEMCKNLPKILSYFRVILLKWEYFLQYYKWSSLTSSLRFLQSCRFHLFSKSLRKWWGKKRMCEWICGLWTKGQTSLQSCCQIKNLIVQNIGLSLCWTVFTVPASTWVLPALRVECFLINNNNKLIINKTCLCWMTQMM